MSETGEKYQAPVPKETLITDNKKYQNLLGEDTRQRGRNWIGGNTEFFYEPKPCNLVKNDGFSLINPDYFRESWITPVREKYTTEVVVPLNKIIALDTTEDIPRQNYDPSLLPWEISGHIGVAESRRLIKENKFNFDDTDGLYGLELPGGYVIATGGRHRLTAMFLENIKETKIHLHKIANPKEFYFTKPYNEYDVQDSINSGKIKGKIEENPDHSKKLVLDEPIENPLQLFGRWVSNELLDVLAQTL